MLEEGTGYRVNSLLLQKMNTAYLSIETAPPDAVIGEDVIALANMWCGIGIGIAAVSVEIGHNVVCLNAVDDTNVHLRPLGVNWSQDETVIVEDFLKLIEAGILEKMTDAEFAKSILQVNAHA